MKRPIEPSEIRKNDKVRFEGEDPYRAHEWVAVDDRHTPSYSGTQSCGEVGHYFLLDRPMPPVELPTEFTLGWVTQVLHDNTDSQPTLGAWRVDADVDDSLSPAALGAIAWDLWDKDTYWKVTSFTPATAIPTAALDRFRHQRDTRNMTNGDIDTFLAAVDAAGSQS